MNGLWSIDGFFARNADVLIIGGAVCAGAFTTYRRRRALRLRELSLCPRCGLVEIPESSLEAVVCDGCAAAARRDGRIAYLALLAASLIVGLMLVGSLLVSTSGTSTWNAMIHFGPLEAALLGGALAAHSQVTQNARK